MPITCRVPWPLGPSCFKTKVPLVIVAGFIASLKVTAIFALMATPVAPLAGTVKVTVGARGPEANVVCEKAERAQKSPRPQRAMTDTQCRQVSLARGLRSWPGLTMIVVYSFSTFMVQLLNREFPISTFTFA